MAIISGKSFKTESLRRWVVKKDGDSAEDPNNDSDYGSESASECEPPKVVSCNLVIMLFLSNSVRIMCGGVSWHSSRAKAWTTTDSYTFHLIPCLSKVSSHDCHHPVGFKHLKRPHSAWTCGGATAHCSPCSFLCPCPCCCRCQDFWCPHYWSQVLVLSPKPNHVLQFIISICQ